MEVQEPCPWLPGWVIAGLFIIVWLSAWAAGEVTVAKETIEALMAGELNIATLFTILWLIAWTFGGCVACRFGSNVHLLGLFQQSLQWALHEWCLS